MVLVDQRHDHPGILIPVHRKLYQSLTAGKLKECAKILVAAPRRLRVAVVDRDGQPPTGETSGGADVKSEDRLNRTCSSSRRRRRRWSRTAVHSPGSLDASALTQAVCTVMLLMASLPVASQVVTVTVQGRVYDSSGAAISQATVTAVNAATGLSRTTAANAVGDYQIPLLPPGDYTVTAEKTGFQKSAKKIHLDIGAAGSLDFSLSPGQVIAQVEVQDVGRTGGADPHHG